jgi:GTP diphosphokinase / guanosine-3',5'-bis(diphosphate) 3'-diphosphatase
VNSLQYYPRIKEATRQHPSIKNTYHTLISIYNGSQRSSGRLVIDHCLSIAETVTHYVTHPIYIQAALLHDLMEDFRTPYEDVSAISGSGRKGEICAQIVMILSKPDIQNKWIRDQIYMRQLWRNIIIKRQKEIGIIKLADRLDNLSDLTYLSPDRIAFILWQSIFFYVPLAIKLNLPGLSKKILIAVMRHQPNNRKEI